MRGVRGPQLDNSHSHSEREPSYRSQRCDQMLIDTILYCDDVIGKDIIGLAETGSGKTAAFALPILQALLDTPTRLFALVLTPTRLVQLTRLSPYLRIARLQLGHCLAGPRVSVCTVPFPYPENWHFRYRSSLRPWALGLESSVVRCLVPCGAAPHPPPIPCSGHSGRGGHNHAGDGTGKETPYRHSNPWSPCRPSGEHERFQFANPPLPCHGRG